MSTNYELSQASVQKIYNTSLQQPSKTNITTSLICAAASDGSSAELDFEKHPQEPYAPLLLMASNRQTERGERKRNRGRKEGKNMKDKEKQTQTSRVIEAVCESHVRQPTPWRKQQLVCTLTALQGLWPQQP